MKINVIVRFTENGTGSETLRDLNIPVKVNPRKDDVDKLLNTSWLKQMIRSKEEGTARKRLRLIYNGRVLNKDLSFKTDVLDPRIRQLSELDDPMDSIDIYIHCLVGEIMTNDELTKESELDSKPQVVSTSPEVVGLDRLLLQGVSQQDVNDMRRQIQAAYLANETLRGSEGGINDEEEIERREALMRQLEEEWLESTVNGSASFQPNVFATRSAAADEPGVAVPNNPRAGAVDFNGSLRIEDLVLGLLIGGFLGVLAGIFLLMDHSMFNETQRFAIFMGIFANFILALMRESWMYGV